eukprot:2811386-Pleurochrysis_carterae.AAC.1
MPKVNRNDPVAAAGRRVRVYWEGDRKWYAGKVAQYNEVSTSYIVVYDDGDVNAEDLTNTLGLLWYFEETKSLRQSRQR